MCVPVSPPTITKPSTNPPMDPKVPVQDPIQGKPPIVDPIPSGFAFAPLMDVLRAVTQLVEQLRGMLSSGKIDASLPPVPTCKFGSIEGHVVGTFNGADVSVAKQYDRMETHDRDAVITRAKELSTSLNKPLAVFEVQSTAMMYPPPAPVFHIIEVNQSIRQSGIQAFFDGFYRQQVSAAVLSAVVDGNSAVTSISPR